MSRVQIPPGAVIAEDTKYVKWKIQWISLINDIGNEHLHQDTKAEFEAACDIATNQCIKHTNTDSFILAKEHGQKDYICIHCYNFKCSIYYLDEEFKVSRTANLSKMNIKEDTNLFINLKARAGRYPTFEKNSDNRKAISNIRTLERQEREEKAHDNRNNAEKNNPSRWRVNKKNTKKHWWCQSIKASR